MTAIEEDVPSLRQRVDALRAELAQERQQARSRELARMAVSQLDVDPQRALLLAMEASTAAVTHESRLALQQAVSATRLRWVFKKESAARLLHAYFAQDNQCIITAGQDGVLRWWDLEAKMETGALNCGADPIQGVRLSPRRDWALVTAENTSSGMCRHLLVALSERRVVATLEGDCYASCDSTTVNAFFSEDGCRLVTNAECGNDLLLWDSNSGVCLFRAAEIGRCHGIDREGRHALVTRCDCSVVVMNLDGNGGMTVLPVPSEKVTVSSWSDLSAGRAPFSADGTRVTAGTSDRVVCVWDARDGHLLHVLGEGCPAHQSSASFSPGGRYITVQQNDSAATEVWEAETGKFLCRLPHSSAFQAPLRFLPVAEQPNAHEQAVVSLGSDDYAWPLPVNRVNEWDLKTGAVRAHFRLPGKQSFQRCFTTDGTAAHFGMPTEQDDISLDASWVLRLADGAVQVFARVEPVELPEVSAEHGCGYTPDRRVGYAASGQILIDSRTNQELAPLGGLQDRYWFSTDGQHLVTASHTETNPIVQAWDARTGQLRFTINAFTRRITTLQFQPGQKHLLVGSEDRTMRLWSLETGTETACITVDAPDGPSYEAVSSRDGTKVAFATSGRLHVWQVDRGEIVQAPTTLYAKGARFSADGSWLLAADEHVARIWEATTMQVISEFPWHFTCVLSGDISPDQQFAATCGLDNHIRLWDPLTGREITHWKLPEGQQPRWLRFSEDGAYLYYPGGERLLVNVEQLIALAKTRAFRELSPDERRLFLGDDSQLL